MCEVRGVRCEVGSGSKSFIQVLDIIMRIWQYSPSISQYLTLATLLFHWLAGETFDKQGLFRGTTLSGFTGSFDMSAAPMQRITYNLEMSLPLMD